MDPAPLEPPRFDPERRRAVLLALSLVTILASFEATVVSTAMLDPALNVNFAFRLSL